MYAALLLALAALGVAGFVWLRRRMAAAAVPEPPHARLLAVFVAYGALLLFGVSGAFGAWSAVHSLVAAVLLAIGAPWLTVQGLVTLVRGAPTRYHRSVAVLSLAFPVVLAGLYASFVARM